MYEQIERLTEKKMNLDLHHTIHSTDDKKNNNSIWGI